MAVVPIAALPLPDPLGLRLRPARTRQHCLVLLHAFPLPLRSFPPSHLSVSIGNRDRERVSAVFFFLKECLVRVLLSPGWTAPAPPRPTRSNPPLLRVRRAHRLSTALSPPFHRPFAALSPPVRRGPSNAVCTAVVWEDSPQPDGNYRPVLQRGGPNHLELGLNTRNVTRKGLIHLGFWPVIGSGEGLNDGSGRSQPYGANGQQRTSGSGPSGSGPSGAQVLACLLIVNC